MKLAGRLCAGMAMAWPLVAVQSVDQQRGLRGDVHLEGCGAGESLLFANVRQVHRQSSAMEPCMLMVYDGCSDDDDKVILKMEAKTEELETCIHEYYHSQLQIQCTNNVIGSYEIRTAHFQEKDIFKASQWDQARNGWDFSRWDQTTRMWDFGVGCPPKNTTRVAPTLHGICFKDVDDCSYSQLLEVESDALSCVNSEENAESFMIGGFGGRCEDIVTCYDTCSDCSCAGVNALMGDCTTDGGSYKTGRNGKGLYCNEIVEE